MSMHFLIILFCSSLASFVGSLQLGPVNLYVIDTALNKNKESACWVAIGGVVPEFIYCALAVYSGGYFLNNKTIFIAFKILMIVGLAILGVVYLFKKSKNTSTDPQPAADLGASKAKYFLKGLTLAGFNPQLLPYWLFVLVYFNSVNFLEIKSELDKIAYILGAGIGAFILLFLIIRTVKKFKTKILEKFNAYQYKVLAVLFLAISLHQLITLL